MSAQIPGWYVDLMEQNLASIIAKQREGDFRIELLVEMFSSPENGTSEPLTPEQHTETLALCLAICVRRLARVDMPA